MYILLEKDNMRKTLLDAPFISSPHPSFDAVIEASRDLNHDQFGAWQKSGTSLDITREDGTTPVMFFADKGQFEAVKIYAHYCPLAAAQQLKSAFKRAVQRNDGYGLLQLINFYDKSNFLAEKVFNSVQMSEIYQKSLHSAVTGQRDLGMIAMLIQEMFFGQISEESLKDCVLSLRKLPQSQELIHVLLRGIARGINSSYNGHSSIVCSGFNPVTDRLDLSSNALTDSELIGFPERLFPRIDESFSSGYSFGYESENDASPPLQQLNLANNHLGRPTGIALANAFNAHCALSVLDLSNNLGFGGGEWYWDSGLQKLVKALHHNNTLLFLNLENTGSNNRDFATVVEMLEKNRTLRLVDISTNRLITSASEPLWQPLQKTRYQQKRHCLLPVVTDTGLAKMMKPPISPGQVDDIRKAGAQNFFKKEITHGVAWVKFESFGNQRYERKVEAHESEYTELAMALMHCAQYAIAIGLPVVWGIGSTFITAKSTGALFNKIVEILGNLNHHHDLLTVVIELIKETVEAKEHGHAFFEAANEIYRDAIDRDCTFNTSKRLQELSRDFSDKNLCELLGHQLYYTYAEIVEQLSPIEAETLGKLISDCLSQFVNTSKTLNWGNFIDDFHRWLLTIHPIVDGCDTTSTLSAPHPYRKKKYYRSVWLIDFLRKSGLICLDSTGKNVRFDIQIKIDGRKYLYVSTDGECYGHRRASQSILDKINSLTEPYRNFGPIDNPIAENKFYEQFNSATSSRDSTWRFSMETMKKLSQLGPLKMIPSNFKTTGQRIADLEKLVSELVKAKTDAAAALNYAEQASIRAHKAEAMTASMQRFNIKMLSAVRRGDHQELERIELELEGLINSSQNKL
jgi:hypothetical protein